VGRFQRADHHNDFRGGLQSSAELSAAGGRISGVARRMTGAYASLHVGGRGCLGGDGFFAQLVFEGLRDAGQVFKFFAEFEPMLAAHGIFEGGLNYAPHRQSGC
jgi:hypothetical protein